jgi:RND superfamily putative drug exporter
MLTRLAQFVHARGRAVLAVAVIGAAVAGAFGFGVASHLSPYSATDPASQSVRATNRFQAAAGRQIDPGIVALVRSGPVRSPAARARVQQIAAELASEPNVAAVSDYYSSGNPAMISTDGRETFVLVYFRPLSDKALQDEAKVIEARLAGAADVTLGGGAVANAQVNSQVSHDLAHAELLAFPFIFLLSLLFFRSLVAALLPPLLGGLAIVVTFFALRVISSFADLSVFALNLVTGMGLGLAIDYSLFMVSRYREEAAAGGFDSGALVRTLNTAGRTILFSSVTVAAAVASLAVFPQNFLYSMGIAGALVALLAAALALVVLPALLGVLGPRINSLAPKRLARAADRDARPDSSGGWYRFARFVMRRAGWIAVLSASALIALGIPFTGIRFITVTTSVLPQSASSRQVDEALRTNFPLNTAEAVDVVVGLPASSPAAATLRAGLARMPDVAAVSPPQAAGGALSLIDVAPRDTALTQATKELVHRIRALKTPYYVGVAGQTASYLDLETSLGSHLPLALAIVVGATLVALFLMTGSVLLPLKAVLMNALSLSAMFGLLVLVFQDGNLQGLLGYRSEGALDATQPIFLFAVGFGLATDYGVFLLSRIKEARDAGASNTEAVAIGLERTGRIVTSAALLFAVAIGAFITSDLVFIKELGFGAALVVLIDASAIRALLVPSLMKLLGSLNWWAPAPLRWVYEHVGVRETEGAGRPARTQTP